MELVQMVDEYGWGFDRAFVPGIEAPLFERRTIGGPIVDATTGPVVVSYTKQGFPDVAEFAITRDGEALAFHVSEGPEVVLGERYKRILDEASEVSVEFGGFTGEVVSLDDSVWGTCVRYEVGRLHVRIGSDSFPVEHGNYHISADWVVAVTAAFKFDPECVPQEFVPNIQYSVIRRVW